MFTEVMLEGISSISLISLKRLSKYSFIYCLLYSFSTPELIAKLKSVSSSGFDFGKKK